MFQKSPRAYLKPDISGCTTGRSINAQSRIKQRLSSSPLKLPLENAINKAIAPKDNGERFSNSRILMKSRLKQQRDYSASRIISRNIYKDEPDYLRQKMHSQTNNFLKKYFSNCNNDVVPIQKFIQCIMREYQHLWGTQNSNKVFEDFNYKIYEIFSENISLKELIKRTINDGMIGLILEIFKQIKSEEKIKNSNFLTINQNPRIQSLRRSFEQQLVDGESLDNIKNVVQQFMETMYQTMQSQIYNKFNVQMRRMVVKYREAQRLMKKVNQKITSHAQIFDYYEQLRIYRRQYDEVIENLKKDKQQLSKQLFREKNNVELERRHNYKLEQQNKRLKQNLQKFQNVVLNKVMEPSPNYLDQTLSRKLSSNSTIVEKQNMLPDNKDQFKITIDTHVIQKDGEPPQTKTYATLYNLGSLMNQSQIQNQTPIPINNLDGPATAQSRFFQPSQYTPTTPYSRYQNSYARSTSPINLISKRL